MHCKPSRLEKRGHGRSRRTADLTVPSANAAVGLVVLGAGFAVMLGVMLARLNGVMSGVRRMAVRGVRMMGCGLV